MPHSIRPTKTFVLRLWHEPDDQAGDAGWRGLLRPLDAREITLTDLPFYGLDDLLAALRRALAEEGPSAPPAGVSGD